MPGLANKGVAHLKLRGSGKVDNKSLAAGALTARTNQSADSADNGVNLEVLAAQTMRAASSLWPLPSASSVACPAETSESKGSFRQSR